MAKTKKTAVESAIETVEKEDIKSNKQELQKSKTSEKALFIQRLAAFILDVFIVSMVASLVSYPFLDLDSIDKLNEASTQIVDQYMTQKISIDNYVSESISISYEMARKQGVVSLITIFLNVLYFVVFQIKNDGQTIGKKLLKIKIESTSDDKLTMNQMIFRSLIINSILVDMVSFCFLLFTNREAYFYGAGVLSIVQFVIIALSGFMVMFSEKRRGVHDMIAHTNVVRCDLVKEMEKCEN